MKKVVLINTELGNIPVVIIKKIYNDEEYFEGTILGENNIFICTKSESFCVDQLRKAFECIMHFWVRQELLDVGLSYEGKINNEWYNE